MLKSKVREKKKGNGRTKKKKGIKRKRDRKGEKDGVRKNKNEETE